MNNYIKHMQKTMRWLFPTGWAIMILNSFLVIQDIISHNWIFIPINILCILLLVISQILLFKTYLRFKKLYKRMGGNDLTSENKTLPGE